MAKNTGSISPTYSIGFNPQGTAHKAGSSKYEGNQQFIDGANIDIESLYAKNQGAAKATLNWLGKTATNSLVNAGGSVASMISLMPALIAALSYTSCVILLLLYGTLI